LKSWTDEEAQSAQTYSRLAETAVLHGEGQAGLWQDPDLQVALKWQEHNQPNEVWGRRYHPEFASAMGFLKTSKVARRRKRLTLAGVTLLVALVSEIFVESVQKAAEAFGMTPAFVGFIVVALVGGAAEMASAFSGARKDRLDLSVGIALGSASQIALFVAPVLVLLSYVIGPAPMDLQFWPGAVVMMLIATMTAMFVTVGGRSAWFVGVLLLMVYAIFAMTLYLMPPGAQ